MKTFEIIFNNGDTETVNGDDLMHALESNGLMSRLGDVHSYDVVL